MTENYFKSLGYVTLSKSSKGKTLILKRNNILTGVVIYSDGKVEMYKNEKGKPILIWQD